MYLDSNNVNSDRLTEEVVLARISAGYNRDPIGVKIFNESTAVLSIKTTTTGCSAK